MCDELLSMPNGLALKNIPKKVDEIVPILIQLCEGLSWISSKTLSYVDALRKDLEELEF